MSNIIATHRGGDPRLHDTRIVLDTFPTRYGPIQRLACIVSPRCAMHVSGQTCLYGVDTQKNRVLQRECIRYNEFFYASLFILPSDFRIYFSPAGMRHGPYRILSYGTSIPTSRQT